jgi:hypothetical protein
MRVKKHKASDNWIISRNIWNKQRGKFELESSGSREPLNTFGVHKNKTNRGVWIYVALGRSRVQFWAQQQNQEVQKQYHKNAAIEFTRKWKVKASWACCCKCHHCLRMFPHIPCTCPDMVNTHKAALPHLTLHACSNLTFVSLCRQRWHSESCSAFPMQFLPRQKQVCSSVTTHRMQYRYGSSCIQFPFFFIYIFRSLTLILGNEILTMTC